MASYNYEHFLEWRGIDTSNGDIVCKDCGGAGYKGYANTSTWSYGIGGAAMTRDVCDICWGSGVSNKPWPSWRSAEMGKRK